MIGRALAIAAAAGGSLAIPALTLAASNAPCRVDAKDLYGIQQVEAPSAVVQLDGTATNPDGSLIRGDGGDSYGPFQFNVPANTWAYYGNGGNPDNYADAAAATARMLCAHGYSSNRYGAIKAHNGSGPAADAYARRVIAIADNADLNTVTAVQVAAVNPQPKPAAPAPTPTTKPEDLPHLKAVGRWAAQQADNALGQIDSFCTQLQHNPATPTLGHLCP